VANYYYMQDLIKQEQFELEVLERLNSGRFLGPLAFGGGTMMRLCFGLNRFSLDLDFWVIKEIDKSKFFNGLKKYLAQYYTLRDSASKFYTMLFELKSDAYPRSLKIEIRKETRKIATEQAIAYSQYANTQVILKAVSLKEMMQSKIQAFLDRKEIRDVFDIEFLLKKGIELAISPQTGTGLLKTIDTLNRNDYAVKLGSLLEANQRKYYRTENFKLLKSALHK